MTPGTIVRCRNRDWVLLPDDGSGTYQLRPLTGSTDDVVAVHRDLAKLIGYSLPEEIIRPASFPLPTANDLADAAGAHLLWQAARLTLREGAAPFRSLGRIAIRPRVYQFVPLLMALRLDPVRLLIADDVGVGKTIEALLVARELLDRGEIRQLCILCPPYLCEQWQKELLEKFHLESVIIRAGTVGQLERRKSGADSIYRHYPIQVASIDFLKSDRNRHAFVMDCPEFVIVDEAHGSAPAADVDKRHHQRFELLTEIAADPTRHMVLLTATPHSGVESAFRSLLGLLRSEFAAWDTSALSESQRVELARHFVQRTRRDIVKDWEGEHCFPERDSTDATYRLSRPYRELFDKTYEFCMEIVRAGQSLEKRKRRARYWGALALLRCVMSSPAAAVAALASRHAALPDSEDEPDFQPFVFESGDETTDDEPPVPPVEAADATLADADRCRLRELAKQAAKLQTTAGDTKLAGCADLVAGLLREGHSPIVWCRYIATADHLAERLHETLRGKFPKLRVVAVTGRMNDDERRAKVDDLEEHAHRVLVATDCLSEGINLQEHWNAVLHYDLPWNPNRLEQREGRVDRYGQKFKIVKAIGYFSPDSPVDGVVLDVLLNKARQIHKTLGTHVPVPEEGETVTEALLNALFLRGRPTAADGPVQLEFDFGDSGVEEFHGRWDRDAERERINRTRFAQRALKPAEVRQELEAADAVLGDPAAVQEFILNAAQRVGLVITVDDPANVFRINLDSQVCAVLPDAVRLALPNGKAPVWRISFVSPTPEGAEYVGRNHPFVESLARFLMEDALNEGGRAKAARCGVIRTRAISRLTTLLLLRVRYLLQQPDRHPLLSEEVIVEGLRHPSRGRPEWLGTDEAMRLLAEARPDANISMGEKRERVEAAVESWPALQTDIARRVRDRAAELEKSHKRVRQAVGMKVRQLTVEPQFPPDLLGLLVLQPVVGS